MPAIEVERRVDAAARAAGACRVIIDGLTRGSVERGEAQRFPVDPGVHTVRLMLAEGEVAPVKVVVHAGVTRLTCATRARRALGFALGGAVTSLEVCEEWAAGPAPRLAELAA